MSLSAFLAGNALKPETVRYVASGRFRDENGVPVEWELRPLTSAEDRDIRAACSRRVKTPGRKNVYQSETDTNAYISRMTAAAVVYPNLNSRELQDSYHAMDAVSLLEKMLLAGEFTSLAQKVQEICGFDPEELVEEAKN